MLTKEKLNEIDRMAVVFSTELMRDVPFPISPDEASELVQMARRYAWLREKFDVPRINTPPHGGGYYTPEELDAAIDQAIAESKD